MEMGMELDVERVGFKERLRAGPPLVGTIVTTPATEVAEVLGQAGYDWLMIDLEHGCLGFPDVQRLAQAAAPYCACGVRVPACDGAWIKKALDTGCEAVIVPQINTASEARRAVAFAKLPPVGSRGLGISRSTGFGARIEEYGANANETVALIVQIEHRTAVRNLDAILRVNGIDGVFIGPYDLSASMGLPGQVSHPRVQKAVAEVMRKCRARGMPFGIFAMEATLAKQRIEEGCAFLLLGIDTCLLRKAALAALELVK